MTEHSRHKEEQDGHDNKAFSPAEQKAPNSTDDSDIHCGGSIERNGSALPSADPNLNPPSELTLADAVDELQQKLGGYGRYQLFIYFLISLIYMRGGWHVWIPIYQCLAPGQHCRASPGLSLNESVPGSIQDGVWAWDECRQYVNLSISNDTEPCKNGWTYLWDSPYTSIVSEFDLVCDHAYQSDLTTTIYMVGTTCGVVFLTPLADRLGSKTIMLACLWIQTVIATCLIWSGNVIVFSVLKFFIGMCNMTIALSAFVLMTETFDAAHREIPTIAMQFFWAVGIMSMALFGYLIPKWQDLELTIALPINVLSLTYVYLVPDSLSWLLSKGKLRKAEAVINRFIKVNGLPHIPDLKQKLSRFRLEKKEKSTSSNKKAQHSDAVSCQNTTRVDDSKMGDGDSTEASPPVYTILTLFKTRKLRIYSLIMFYLFLVNALAYFGIMYSTPELNGDRFLNLFLLGVVEIPAYIMCLLANRIIGRRRSISIFLFICAAANLAVIFTPDTSDDGTDLKKLKTALIIIGKFGITGSYSTIYLYASEVFPTVIRNQAVGASSFFENVGSIAAPNMVYVNNSMNNLPLGIFGGMTIIGCGLVLLLPETHNQPLPQTIEDVEHRQSTSKTEVTMTEIYKQTVVA